LQKNLCGYHADMTDIPDWFDPAQDALLTPKALRGLVHPIRLRLLDLLQADGPATATSLAQRIGQSSGVTSYHLRVLAEHGFIAEDQERGTGRDRWWRALHRTTSFTFRTPKDPGAEDAAGEAPGAEDAGAEDAVEEGERFVRLVAQEQHRRVLAWIATLAGEREKLAGIPWTVSDWPLQLTLDEARELKLAMQELAVRYRRDPADPSPRPGTVRAHIAFQLTPEDP
jgi:DNA-binding transcriptional ArsR family regulator